MTTAEFHAWLKRNDRSHGQLAIDLDKNIRTISRWAAGEPIPRSCDLALRWLEEHYTVVAPP